MVNYIKNLVRDEAGVTAVEYSVMAVLIVAALVVAVGTLTTGISGAMTTIAAAL